MSCQKDEEDRDFNQPLSGPVWQGKSSSTSPWCALVTAFLRAKLDEIFCSDSLTLSPRNWAIGRLFRFLGLGEYLMAVFHFRKIVRLTDFAVLKHLQINRREICFEIVKNKCFTCILNVFVIVQRRHT